MLGYGPIERFLADPTVTEVMVNGCSSIYVERAGKLYRTEERFDSDARLRQVIDKIVSAVGRRIDESSPMVDARLADGSRVNAVIPPLAIDGPTLTVRKFAKHRLTVDDMISFGTLTPETTDFLSACVAGRLNILISGGTGTGKTTLLNVLSSLIPETERIVTIEDAAELQLDQDHLIRLESRPQNMEGRGAITIRDLVRNALRMRPDRIIVGEVRGGETLDMLQAMNTGHDGSLSTVHANSPRDALFRLETMTLMAGMDLPLRAIRDQIASALDLVVHISRLRDGSRRVTQISEIVGRRGRDRQHVRPLRLRLPRGDGRGRPPPAARSCRPGCGPAFAERLRDAGIELPARLLGIDARMLAAAGGPAMSAVLAADAGGSWMLIAGAAALFLALFVGIAAVTLPGVRRRRLARELAVATEEPSSRSQMSALGAKAAELAERGLARHDRDQALAVALERAGIDMRGPEFVVLAAATSLGAAFVGALLGGPVVALIGVGARRRRLRRRRVGEDVAAPQDVRGAAARHPRAASRVDCGPATACRRRSTRSCRRRESPTQGRVPAGAVRDPARSHAARRAARSLAARSAARTSTGSCRRSGSSATSVATSRRCSTTSPARSATAPGSGGRSTR